MNTNSLVIVIRDGKIHELLSDEERINITIINGDKDNLRGSLITTTNSKIDPEAVATCLLEIERIWPENDCPED